MPTVIYSNNFFFFERETQLCDWSENLSCFVLVFACAVRIPVRLNLCLPCCRKLMFIFFLPCVDGQYSVSCEALALILSSPG